MWIQQLIFYVFAALVLLAGLAVIVVRDPVRSALALVVAFLAAVGLWLLLEAEFLALILILVYVGAVMTLFLFVVMTLNVALKTSWRELGRYLPYGILIVALLIALVVYAIYPAHSNLVQTTTKPLQPADYSNIKALGEVLYTQYAYPFELAGALLLVAIVAAISLTFRGSRNRKGQEVAKQLCLRREDRIKLVDMKTDNNA